MVAHRCGAFWTRNVLQLLQEIARCVTVDAPLLDLPNVVNIKVW